MASIMIIMSVITLFYVNYIRKTNENVLCLGRGAKQLIWDIFSHT